MCRWQRGSQGLAGPERRSSHGIPLLCPPRQAGQRAAGQRSWLGNGYLWATGKVSHLRITHSQRGCVKKERRRKGKDSGRVAVLSCSSDHEEKRQRCGLRAEEKESDMSLVQRYALVNSTLKRCCCLIYICCQTGEPERRPAACWTVHQTCNRALWIQIIQWDYESL